MDTPLPTWAGSLLAFVERHRCSGALYGRFRFSAICQQPTLYSSTYAAMARHLLGDLDNLPADLAATWIEYLNHHQDEDGLFRDPAIYDQGGYAGDPLWCGRPHLTCHVVAALACLGGVPRREIAWLDPWRNVDRLVAWLCSRDWGQRIAWTGNEIMNVGTLLQYARDYQNDARAAEAVSVLIEWLATNHLNPHSGLWGDLDVSDPIDRSHAVMAAYHWWPLFFYDSSPIPHIERAIDALLATQNPAGGFGWGVHNPGNPAISSACEDIDSIDPLCRMSALTSYRRSDIRAAMRRAAEWVRSNQMPDGGFAFLRDCSYEYGHPQLNSQAGQGAMFPTWFRLLSLAIIGRAFPEHELGQFPWRFLRCPGMQF